jgi:hypothetical protein
MKSDPELILLLEQASELLEDYAEICEERGKRRRAEAALSWVENADEWRKQQEAN